MNNSKTSDLKIEILNYINQNNLIVNNDIIDKLLHENKAFYQNLIKIKNDLVKLNNDPINKLLLNKINELNININDQKNIINNLNNELNNLINDNEIITQSLFDEKVRLKEKKNIKII